MRKEIIFYDLDDTLWKIKDETIWVIDKEKPGRPLIEIDKVDFVMIRNKAFVKDDLPLQYNGQKFYISKDMFEVIKKKSGSENIERFGISFIPLVKKDILDEKEIVILLKNIEHLRYNKFVDIGILTARSNRKTHADLINKLRLKLKSIGIEISKIFFTGDGLRKGKNYYDKVSILLEHLIGFKIIGGKFVSQKQDWYKKVSFYDDDVKNIEYADDVQSYLNDLLRKTDDELFKIIVNKIKENELVLETNLVTGNDLNRFKTNKIILKEPIRFPINEKLITKFDNFKKKI